jgi:hypothetical protein
MAELLTADRGYEAHAPAASDRTTLLAAFLRSRIGLPFVWGRTDCALFVADWVRAATGRDGAKGLRGRYACEASARATLAGTSLLRTVDRCARGIGLARTRTPVAGDIGIVLAPGPICAIRTASGWVCQGDFVLERWPAAGVRLLMAWRV